jgi:hypothetical protein
VINPTKLVTTPHEEIQVEDLEVYITAEGDSYGGVVVPLDYMKDPKLAVQLVSQALRSTEESLRRLRKAYKDMRDLYTKVFCLWRFQLGTGGCHGRLIRVGERHEACRGGRGVCGRQVLRRYVLLI